MAVEEKCILPDDPSFKPVVLKICGPHSECAKYEDLRAKGLIRDVKPELMKKYGCMSCLSVDAGENLDYNVNALFFWRDLVKRRCGSAETPEATEQ